MQLPSAESDELIVVSSRASAASVPAPAVHFSEPARSTRLSLALRSTVRFALRSA